MSISLVIVTLIGGALVGVIMAVSESWRAAAATQTLQVSGRQGSMQLYRLLRSAAYIGLATADDQQRSPAQVTQAAPGAGAMLMYWREDDGDGYIQLWEVSLIEHDRAGNTLRLYDVPKSAPNANTPYELTDMDDSGDAAAFKTLSTVQWRVIARHVQEARFARNLAGGLPEQQALEFTLTISPDASETRGSHLQSSEFGTVALRCAALPKKRP